jgi:hypothetical protein
MKYDISKAPPTCSQISDQLQRSTENSELLSLYQMAYWIIQVLIFVILVAIIFYIESPIWQGMLLGTTSVLGAMLFLIYWSFIEDKKFRYTHEIQTHYYIDNSVLETVVFENWCSRVPEVQRYVSVVSDRGRSLTFGEYLAIKDRVASLYRHEAPDEPITAVGSLSEIYH